LFIDAIADNMVLDHIAGICLVENSAHSAEPGFQAADGVALG
jgi:hypothetical protein